MATERTDKEHHGLKYTGSGTTADAQTIFVKPITSDVKNDKDMKLKTVVATPIRAPAVTPTRTLVATPSITPSMTQGRIREKICVSIFHYCNKKGHIRPRCYQYLADLKRVDQEKVHLI